MFSFSSIVVWAFFGLLTGGVVAIFDRKNTRYTGIGSTLLLGVLGAIFGGMLAQIIFGRSLQTFSLQTVATIIAVAFITILLQRVATR